MVNLKVFVLQPLFALAEWYQTEQNEGQTRIFLQQALAVAQEINHQRSIATATSKLEELA